MLLRSAVPRRVAAVANKLAVAHCSSNEMPEMSRIIVATVPMMHRGGCLCGSVKYSIVDNLKFVVNCHCRFCSKAHGAAFTTLLIMPFNKLEVIAGQALLSAYEVKTLNALRVFCSQCGTSVQPFSVEGND